MDRREGGVAPARRSEFRLVSGRYNERAPGRGLREKLPEPGALVPDQTVWSPRSLSLRFGHLAMAATVCASGRNISSRTGPTGC